MKKISKSLLICFLVFGITFSSVNMTQKAEASGGAIVRQSGVHEQLKLNSTPLPTDGVSFKFEDQPFSGWYDYEINNSGEVIVLDKDKLMLHQFNSTGTLVKSIKTNHRNGLSVYHNMVLVHDGSSQIDVYHASTLDYIANINLNELPSTDKFNYQDMYVVAVDNLGVIIAIAGGTSDERYTNYYTYELAYDETFITKEIGSLEQAPYISDMYLDTLSQTVKSKYYSEALYTFDIENATITLDDLTAKLDSLQGRIYQDQSGLVYVDSFEGYLLLHNRAGLHLFGANIDGGLRFTQDRKLVVNRYVGNSIYFEGYVMADIKFMGENPTLYDLPNMNQIPATSITADLEEGLKIIDLDFDFPYETRDPLTQIGIFSSDDYSGIILGNYAGIGIPGYASDVSYVQHNNNGRNQLVVQFSHIGNISGLSATVQIIIDDTGKITVQTLDIYSDYYFYYYAVGSGMYVNETGQEVDGGQFDLPASLYSAVEINMNDGTGFTSVPTEFQPIELISNQPNMDTLSFISPAYGSTYIIDGKDANEEVKLTWEASSVEIQAEQNNTVISSVYNDIVIIATDPSFEYSSIYNYYYLDPTINTLTFKVSELTAGLPYYFRVIEEKTEVETDENGYHTYFKFTSAASKLGSFKVITAASAEGPGNGGTPGDGGSTPGTPGDGGSTPGTPGDGGSTPGIPGDGGSTPGTPGSGNVGDESATEAEIKPIVKVNGNEVKTSITNTGLSIQVPNAAESNIELSLNQAVWKELAKNSSSTVQVAVKGANYSVPVTALQINAALRQLGIEADDDFDIMISIQTKDNQRAQRVAGVRNASVIGSPIEFTISVVAKNKEVELNQFNSFVNREIELPDGVSPNQVSTAVVVEENGMRHVPTAFVQNNGKWFASIKSLTNSEYALIYADVSFDDVLSTHWAKDVIEDMGARQIVNGKTSSIFAPNENVTRAEFTAMLIRTLGLPELKYQGSFTDIAPEAWYAGAVETAISYSLITGYEDHTFLPNDLLTREQAMVMVNRATKLVNLQGTEKASDLTGYQDVERISNYAKDSVVELIGLGVMKGRNVHELAPLASITRAEVTQVLYNLLITAKLVD